MDSLFSLTLVLMLASSCQFSNGDTNCLHQTGCKCTTKDFTIDISKAFHYPENQSYVDSSKKNYFMQFDCSGTNCGDKHTDGKTALCQYDPSHDAVTDCGNAGEIVWTVTSKYSFTVTYSKGDPSFDGRNRETEIQFTVTNGTKNSVGFDFLKEDDSDNSKIKYIFTASIEAHGVGGGSAGVAAGIIGIVLIVLILVGIVSYFIIGAIVMYTVKGARGAEVIPNYVFWKSLPGLIKDGCCLTISPCVSLYEKKSGGGYQSL